MHGEQQNNRSLLSVLEAYAEYSSFKEIDSSLKQEKGRAFKFFKKNLSGLKEGDDFIVLNASGDAMLIDALRRQGRIYVSTVNLVLFSAGGRKKLCDMMLHAA